MFFHLGHISLSWLTSVVVLVDFFFNSLVVGVPCSVIFWHFWLFIDFRLVVILLLVVRGSEGFLPTPPSWPDLRYAFFFIIVQYHNWEMDADKIHQSYSYFVNTPCTRVCTFSSVQFHHMCRSVVKPSQPRCHHKGSSCLLL